MQHRTVRDHPFGLAPALGYKILSWNLLRLTGASLEDVIRLIEREQPDVMLLQEATAPIDALPHRIGGQYFRVPLPGRIHGLACWSAGLIAAHPIVVALPSGTIVHRVAQIIDLGAFALANVHLSHGQLLNRRQLRYIAARLPPRAAIVGDYNLVGPAMIAGFHDIGPRRFTHVAADMLPLRLDRCLARGLDCVETAAYPRASSDHRPIMVRLRPAHGGPAAAA